MDLLSRFVSRPDYHQLPAYARVMERIGWDVIPMNGQYLFVRRIGPISIAKFQRPQSIDFSNLKKLQKRLPLVKTYIDPGLSLDLEILRSNGLKETKNHHAYTKTFICNLHGSEEKILASFSKTLKYQMLRSLRMGVSYKVVAFVNLTEETKTEIVKLHSEWETEKKVSGYPNNFLRILWQEMQKEGSMILAYEGKTLHGALYFLHHHGVAMYFYQYTSQKGRQSLYVPSGLAYQTVKLAKFLGCDILDLCSAYDERFGTENLKWKGFSVHKEHFHPTSVYYPPSFQ
ncbi:MAG TPA: hypothetical protein VLH19_00330 [Patescibacteria group bacterium]|nr:hypothetical protein [Patescibacteria group bacterium]